MPASLLPLQLAWLVSIGDEYAVDMSEFQLMYVLYWLSWCTQIQFGSLSKEKVLQMNYWDFGLTFFSCWLVHSNSINYHINTHQEYPILIDPFLKHEK